MSPSSLEDSPSFVKNKEFKCFDCSEPLPDPGLPEGIYELEGR